MYYEVSYILVKKEETTRKEMTDSTYPIESETKEERTELQDRVTGSYDKI